VLDPLIHQAARLRIMAALQRNREARFTALRDALGLTDGNLASHAAVLEKAGYVEARRVLTTGGFELRYRITPRGAAAFLAYVGELKALLESPPDVVSAGPDAPSPAGAGSRPAG